MNSEGYSLVQTKGRNCKWKFESTTEKKTLGIFLYQIIFLRIIINYVTTVVQFSHRFTRTVPAKFLINTQKHIQGEFMLKIFYMHLGPARA